MHWRVSLDGTSTATLVDNQGNEQTVSTSSGMMETELFKIGDIVFIDEDGDIEQAFDEDER